MTQTKSILFYLLKGKTITPLQALNKFGCMRLAARCNDLRNIGHNIVNVWEETPTKRYAKYKLVK